MHTEAGVGKSNVHVAFSHVSSRLPDLKRGGIVSSLVEGDNQVPERQTDIALYMAVQCRTWVIDIKSNMFSERSFMPLNSFLILDDRHLIKPGWKKVGNREQKIRNHPETRVGADLESPSMTPSGTIKRAC